VGWLSDLLSGSCVKFVEMHNEEDSADAENAGASFDGVDVLEITFNNNECK
jgi:hypothetical protein